MGDEQKLEEINFLQDVIHKELPDSPLFKIREKELEISGRVLAAKKQAEQIVADSRKKVLETHAEAEAAAEKDARAAEARIVKEAEEEAARILSNVDQEVAEVGARTAERGAQAAKVVVEAVTKV